MPYNRVGKSGLKLPAMSLGTWHNFSEAEPLSNQRELLRTAFDLGITHFDLADNYGNGAAERNTGKILNTDFAGYRDELIISTKAGHQFWDGPYGDWGSRKHLIAGIDQSLTRLGLDYVDIFYHHRPDPETPTEETATALADIVRQGKALYIGISNYYGEASKEIIDLLQEERVPCLINQLPFNMFDQNAADSGDFASLDESGVGVITFSPLAQGLLTDRYLKGIPEDSRAGKSGTCLEESTVSDSVLKKVKALNEIAKSRSQSLAQMALVWNLNFSPVASVLIGASRAEQLKNNVEALENTAFSTEELQRIRDALAS
ncbi:MAG: aldo/keto reductase [Opitutales bacterium]